MDSKVATPEILRIAILFFSWLGIVQPTAHAAADESHASENPLFELSLEELLDIAVYSRELLGMHHAHPKGEASRPIYQSLDGPQLQNASRFDLSLQWIFEPWITNNT